MTTTGEAEALFHDVGQSLPDATSAQMFGKKCYKAGTKAFVCFFEDCMVFKLSGDSHANALGLEGAKPFDPSGKGRPMKEWVQIPFAHQLQWSDLANAAYGYVAGK